MSFPGPQGPPQSRVHQSSGEESTQSPYSSASSLPPRVGLGGSGPQIHTGIGPPSRPAVLHSGLGNQPHTVVKPPERPAAGYVVPFDGKLQTTMTASLTRGVGNGNTLSPPPTQPQQVPTDSVYNNIGSSSNSSSSSSGFQTSGPPFAAVHQQYQQPPQLNANYGPPPIGGIPAPPTSYAGMQQQSTMYSSSAATSAAMPPSQFAQHQYQQNPPPTMQQQRYPPPATTSTSIPRRPPPMGAGAGIDPTVDAYGPPAPSFGSSSERSSSSGRSSSRIDPSQMPRPPKQMPREVVVFHTRSATLRRVPPPVGSRYQVVDNGNCSPRHLRITTYAPPTTRAVWKQTGVPMAVLATCFADTDVDGSEETVPLVHLGTDRSSSSGSGGTGDSDGGSVSYRPPRCQRCHGYVGPFAAWTGGGSHWTCHLCGQSNETPPWYYSSLDGAGLRLDRTSRPELMRGSVDFCVTSEDYGSRPPQQQVIAFAVDMSGSARANGSALAAIDAVHSALSALEARGPGQQSFGSSSSGSNSSSVTRVGIVSFDESGVTFYLVRRQSAATDGGLGYSVSVLVVDAHDPVAALPSHQWLFPAQNSGGQSESGSRYGEVRVVLDRLRRRCEAEWSTDGAAATYTQPQPQTQTQEGSCPAAAIRAVQLGLADVGGRLFVFAGTPLSYGYGASSRESAGVYGRREELFLYASLDTALSLLADGADVGDAGARSRPALEQGLALAEACARSCLCVDVFFLVEDRLTSDPYGQQQQQQQRAQSSDQFAFRDCAALAECCDRTGGTAHYLTGCLRYRDNALRLRDQLLHCVDQMRSSDVAFKLRVSAGLRVQKYLGPGQYDPLTDQGTCAGMDKDATVGFVLCHDGGGLKDEDKVYAQLAVLYTPSSPFAPTDPRQQQLSRSQSQRRVRVHNLCLISTADPGAVFKNVDPDCVVAALAKLAVDRALRLPLGDVPWAVATPSSSPAGVAQEISNTIMNFFNDDAASNAQPTPAASSSVDSLPARQYLVAVVAELLHKYRKHCAAQSSRAQLILPDTLRLLPLFALGMLKHPSLINNTPVGSQRTAPAGYGNPTLSHPPISSGSGSGLSPSVIQKLAVRAPERACELRRLRCLPIREVVGSLYPSLFSVRELVEADEAGPSSSSPSSESVPGEVAKVAEVPLPLSLSLPPTMAATSEVFASDGLYLLDDCASLWLVVGRAAPLSLLTSLFSGFPACDGPGAGGALSMAVADRPRLTCASLWLAPSDVNTDTDTDPTGTTQPHEGVPRACVVLARLVRALRSRSRCQQELRPVWSDEYGSPDADRVGSRLVEDSIYGTHSYADFLAKLHSYVIAKE